MTTPTLNPPRRTLMGPGPSDVPARVLEALSQPTVGHLDPWFVDLMDEVKGLLQYVMQTDNRLTLPVSAPGSAGMEACFVNLISPGDTVIVCQNGVFGGRMKENVERCGGRAIMVEDPWGEPVNLQKVEEALITHPEAMALAFVHAETSTGVASDARALAELARQHDCLSIVDAVTSLAGIPLKVDDWGIDALYSGTQKCLSCVPGISPVTFSERARDKIAARSHQVQSWFLDMNLVMAYWGEGGARAYHHTAPVNAIYALREALVMVKDEGLENSWQRHQTHHLALKAGLDALGLELIVDQACRLPQLNAVAIPEGVDDGAIRQQLLTEHNLEIGAGLGAFAGKVWRIGLMGHSSRPDNISRCLTALEQALASQDTGVEPGQAVAAADAVLTTSA